MVMDVEIELRVPSFKTTNEAGDDVRVETKHLRFRKVVQVAEFPKPGTKIALNFGSSPPFDCVVTTASWHEEKQKFVIPCQYPGRKISPDEFEALNSDPAWERTELPI